MQTVLLLAIFVFLAACTTDEPRPTSDVRRPASDVRRPASDDQRPSTVVMYQYEIVKRIPHDVTAFTQGLSVHDGVFIESTGQTGMSSVRRVDMKTGKVLKKTDLNAQVFGEGSTVYNNKVYVLSWLNQTGFIFDAQTLAQTGTFSYAGEGWGLTTDGTVMYMSNGTNLIAVRDPSDMHMLRSFTVTQDGSGVRELNELEWVDGEIWANVWRTEKIVRIDPATGNVTGVIDLTGILPDSERPANADVLNGIAYDPTTKAIYVTGKNWPWIYHIAVK